MNKRVGDLLPGRRDVLRLGGYGLLGAFADHKGQYQPPHWCKGNPDPGIAVGLTKQLGGLQILLFGMDKAPQLIQLALTHRQVVPQMEHEQPAMLGCSVQPGTRRILINLDNAGGTAQRNSFRQRTNRHFKNRGVAIQFEVGRAIVQGDRAATGATQGLFLPARCTILDQQAVPKGLPIAPTGAIGTVQRFPVHGILPC